MYLAATIVVCTLLLLLEFRAFRLVLERSAGWRFRERLALWSALLACGVAAIRYIGFAEYPLPFSNSNVTGFGLPIVAVATLHKEHSVLDFSGAMTIPALTADLIVSGLLPVWLVSLCMTTYVHQWHEHTIEVRIRSLPQFLWLLIRAEVIVDRSKHYTERNVVSWRCIVPFEISERDKVVLGRIESFGIQGGVRMNYRVVVEDHVIAEGSTRAGNWYMPYALLAVFLVGWILI